MRQGDDVRFGVRRPSQDLPIDTAELIGRCLDGESGAWQLLVERYERLVYAVPRRLGLGPEDAADVVQDVFATLLAQLDRIEKPESLGSWLMTAARRLTWRRRSRSDLHTGLWEDALIDIETDERAVQTIALARAIEMIGAPCSTLIQLLFLDPDQPSYADVAQCLGCAVGNIGPLRGRCLERLRRALGSTEGWE